MDHLYSLLKIKMRGTTFEKIRQAIYDIGMSKAEAEVCVGLVQAGRKEGNFKWRVRIDTIFSSFFDNLMLEDGGSFGGRILNLRST